MQVLSSAEGESLAVLLTQAYLKKKKIKNHYNSLLHVTEPSSWYLDLKMGETAVFQVAVLLVRKSCHSNLSWQNIGLVMVKVLISSLIKRIY